MSKQADLVVLVLLPIIASAICLFFEVRFITSIGVFFFLPALFIVLRQPSLLREVLPFSIVFGIFLYVFVETLLAGNGVWVILDSVFTIKLLGQAAVEVLFFAIGWVLYVTLFLRYFHLEVPVSTTSWKFPSKRFFYIAFPLMLIVVVFTWIDPALLDIPYLYAVFGLIFSVVPLVHFLFHHKELWQTIILSSGYFVYVHTLNELVSLELGYWTFAHEKSIQMLQFLTFLVPVEEVVVWVLLAAPTLVIYYLKYGYSYKNYRQIIDFGIKIWVTK